MRHIALALLLVPFGCEFGAESISGGLNNETNGYYSMHSWERVTQSQPAESRQLAEVIIGSPGWSYVSERFEAVETGRHSYPTLVSHRVLFKKDGRDQLFAVYDTMKLLEVSSDEWLPIVSEVYLWDKGAGAETLELTSIGRVWDGDFDAFDRTQDPPSLPIEELLELFDDAPDP